MTLHNRRGVAQETEVRGAVDGTGGKPELPPLKGLNFGLAGQLPISPLLNQVDRFRVGRQNEAAGAADATAWVRSAVVAFTVR